MKTTILYIGVTDKDNFVHTVRFNSGVNIITGRSSTGKSALIEIFDYCFGSSDFTVPEGVITEFADIYFVVIKVKNDSLVLARRRGGTKAFIKNESDDRIIETKNSFKKEYFQDDRFLPLADFKKELRRYFGSHLQLTDIDENITDRKYRGGKRPTPSVRSFTSFMLQHQNLVANKHAIFYRFDEKEKREQTIDHFKVFAGFSDQEYFIKRQELEKLENEKRKYELQIPRDAEIKKRAQEKLENALKEYVAISGTHLDIGEANLAVINPKEILEKLQGQNVEVIAVSDEHIKYKQECERELARLTAEYRKCQNQIKDIQSSIEFSENYKKETSSIPVPQKTELHASECPFCHNNYSSVEHQANKLTSAIDWLNDELNRSEYSLESFREDERKFIDMLKEFEVVIKVEKQKIQAVDKQIKELARYKTQYELALKVKLKVETILEELLQKPYEELETKLKAVKEEIKKIKKFLKENYNIEDKLKKAEKDIQSYMHKISSSLEFEDSYKPISLRFSLETFDLWNEMGGKNVYLRAMGSGANWLSCHVALFLALHRYFCELGDNCSIPTTLFFDQPSQVYFPSVLDNSEEFSAEDIAKKEGDSRIRKVDEDIIAVTNLYSELVRFCKDTLHETGIEPQIIVTDHADKLKICGDDTTVTFDALVRERWRGKDSGFIKIHKDLYK